MHATETSLPLVSIIMPAFNGEPYIGAAIRSVLAQSYARWELLILDDGSADRTAEIAEAFEKSDPRIRLFRNPKNLGAALWRRANGSRCWTATIYGIQTSWKSSLLFHRAVIFSTAPMH